MTADNLLSCGSAPSVDRIELSLGVWMDVATAPVLTAVEGLLKAAVEDAIRAGWSGIAEVSGVKDATHAQVTREGLTSGMTSSEADADADTGAAEASSGVPEGLLAQLDLLEAVTQEIASVDPASLQGSVAAEVSRRLRATAERLEAQRLGCIGRVETEGSWAVETMHGFTSYMQAREGLSKNAADRAVRAARRLRDHLPATAAAARAGQISGEHVAIMVRATGTATLRAKLAEPLTGDVRDLGTQPAPGPESTPALDPAAERETEVAAAAAGPTGEEALLELAQVWDVDEFNKLIKRFTVSGDPVAQEKAFKDAVEKEYLQISPTWGGAQITGFLTTEHAQLVNTALRAMVGVPPAGDHAGDLDPDSDTSGGLRLGDLRKVDGLLELAQRALDGGLAGKGANVRPHLSVHITWEKFNDLYETTTRAEAVGEAASEADQMGGGSQRWSPTDLATQLRSGHPTWEDGTGPIPDAVLRRIACDGEVTRIIFGPDSQILNIGRSKRTFTKEHRRAIVARDRTCVWPGCDAPPHVCEIHHAIRHWADNGDTTPSNGALLCRHHHHRVDGEKIAMTYDDRWTVHLPGTYRSDAHVA